VSSGKSATEMAWLALKKRATAEIRARHSSAADAELNERLPQLFGEYVAGLPVFCFDVETRPGPYGGGDYTFKNMLSVAGKFEGKRQMSYLGPGYSAEELEEFVAPLRGETLVVCHNGKYDLPLLAGTLVKNGLAPLPPVLLHDTYACLPKRGGAYSASLGNMAERFAVGASKGHMGEVAWERAYAGDPAALKKLRAYNEGDVRTTLALRNKLMELGLLGPPMTWRP
jgi:hypothetical protein